jgi:parallel beta-helix repeat protein
LNIWPTVLAAAIAHPARGPIAPRNSCGSYDDTAPGDFVNSRLPGHIGFRAFNAPRQVDKAGFGGIIEIVDGSLRQTDGWEEAAMKRKEGPGLLTWPAMESLEARILLSATYYVDQKNPLASDSNAGTDPTHPLLTISRAATKVSAGDTIFISAGIYREEVALSKSGTAAAPITMEGAPGQRVVISGANAITGWTQCTAAIARNNPNWANIYYVDVSGLGALPQALFQDDVPLAKGRTGGYNWWTVTGGTATTISDSTDLTQAAGYWTGADAMYWQLSGTADYVLNITGSASGTLTFSPALGGAGLPVAGDRFWLQDRVELITGEGEWAAEPNGTNTYRIFCWATGGGSPSSHLMELPVRTRFDIEWGSQGYWVFDNLELTKDNGSGIGGWTSGALGHITVQNCSIHHNGNAGIYGRFNGGGVYQDNYIAYNGYGVDGTGVSVSDTGNVLVKNNEIAYNGNDGIDITASNVTLDGNYIHGNWYWGHADDCQCWGTITNVLLENNFILDGGQGFMMEGVNGVTLQNNVIIGSRAYLLIAGHNTTTNLNLFNNTLGFGYYGILNNAGDYYDFTNNIYFEGLNAGMSGFSYTQHYTSDYNLFYKADGLPEAGIVVWTSSTTTYWNDTLAQYIAQSGQDKDNSKYANPMFANAPVQYFILDTANHFKDMTPTRVYLSTDQMSALAVGDHIEIDWDNVVRTITAKGSNYIDFGPGKVDLPLRMSVMVDWKANTNFNLDFSLLGGSPAIGKSSTGGNMGASINTLNYAKDDFNGDGLRDIPRWPVIPGDINRDGAADGGDVDYLYAAIRAHSTSGVFDLNRDGAVNQADVDLLVRTYLNTQYGDANLDGKVAVADQAAVDGNLRKTGAGWAGGDFNGDGVVDAADMSMLKTYWHWQRGASPGVVVAQIDAPVVLAVDGVAASTAAENASSVPLTPYPGAIPPSLEDMVPAGAANLPAAPSPAELATLASRAPRTAAQVRIVSTDWGTALAAPVLITSSTGGIASLQTQPATAMVAQTAGPLGSAEETIPLPPAGLLDRPLPEALTGAELDAVTLA